MEIEYSVFNRIAGLEERGLYVYCWNFSIAKSTNLEATRAQCEYSENASVKLNFWTLSDACLHLTSQFERGAIA